jgi:hypothetical protein
MLLWITLLMLATFLFWQARVRRSLSSESPEGRVHLGELLDVAQVLSWDDPEVRERVALSAENPERYFEEHGSSFGHAGEIWPWPVLCDELVRRDLAVRAADFAAPTLELCRRFDASLARCGVAAFPWEQLRTVGAGGSVEGFLSELGRALEARALVLVHLYDGGQDLLVSVQPVERLAKIDGVTGPRGSYVVGAWSDARA